MNHPNRNQWKNSITFSVTKATEGGIGQSFGMFLLKTKGIPSRKAYSPYVGQTGIEVPKKFQRKAAKLLGC